MQSCIDYGPGKVEEFSFGNVAPGDGVFIVNEGNFMYGNASLSYYTPSVKKVENEVFIRSNGINLGDVAQSMTIYGNKGYIVVNNSSVIFVIDLATFSVTGTIGPLTSPRYIHFVSGDKAYVTDLRNPGITVIDPETRSITGRIDTPGHVSTEQMVRSGNYVFTNCWSHDNKILVIDATTDTVVDSVEVGRQPNSMVIDRNRKIWVLTDGGYTGNQSAAEEPALYRIDAASRTVEHIWRFASNDSPRRLCIDPDGGNIFFINKSIWKMSVDSDVLPSAPIIEYGGTIYYGLAVNPVSGDIYVADAIDYMQPGIIYRYSPAGELLDSFRGGINPGAFCFR